MQLMPHGDYYLWYCDRCDSRNLTLWTRIDTGEITCAACYATNVIDPVSTPDDFPSAA